QQRLRPEQKKIKLDLAPGPHFWLIPFLVIVQLLVFGGLMAQGGKALNQDPVLLFQWGALQRTAILEGELWRLFTSNFLHQDLFHLLSNALVLWIVGRILEPLLGRTNLFILILLSMLTSAVISVFWNPFMMSVGASGITYALFGTTLVFLFSQSSYFKDLVPHVFLLVVLFVLQSVYGAVNPQTNHAAHIGGFLTGMVGGVLLRLMKSSVVPEVPGRGVLGLLGVVCFVFLLMKGRDLPDPVGDFQRVQQYFKKQAWEAEQAWLTPHDSLAFQKAIHTWQLAVDSAEVIAVNPMPEVLQVRLQRMAAYGRLKQKQFDLVLDYLRNDGSYIPSMYRENRAARELLEEGNF
ncbi:MAG: rhomboid family intramembrane serine protease, partial [Bacteroidota bacterium]|nr:rhomboid family intramembrane serine protease [Bacteroidota bacterium]MDX5430375.1 rhomboid family intramembrane serine protease [Bacteroidota bacterium]MDX5469136.1 rhomboid family intramembrane serine protease [Bacteroidota bacterium]